MHPKTKTNLVILNGSTFLALSVLLLFNPTLSVAQDGGFQVSPRGFSDQSPVNPLERTSSQENVRAPIDINRLRDGSSRQAQNELPPINPGRFEKPQSRESILERSPKLQPYPRDQMDTSNVDRSTRGVPPVHQNPLARPLQGNQGPEVSSESFRMGDSPINKFGDIQQVSGNFQDNETLRGPQPDLSIQSRGLNQPQTQTGGSQQGFDPPGQRGFSQQPVTNQRMTNQPPNQPRAGNPPIINNTAAERPQRILNDLRVAANNTNSGNRLANNANLAVAKTLLGEYSLDQAPQPLPGAPTSMQQMLDATPTNDRPAMINQYWETFDAWTQVITSARYLNSLNQFRAPMNPPEKALLATAKSMAENELLAAEIRLTKSQSRLQRFIPNSENQMVLPLPSDQPLISNYTTHFDFYESRRKIPNEIRNIVTALPKMRNLISQQAQTAQGSLSSMNQMQQLVQGGQAPISGAILAAQMWRDSHRQYIASVVDYNRSIAAYSLTVMGTRKSAEQMTIALVGKPGNATPSLRQESNAQFNSGPTNQRGVSQPISRQASLPQEFRNPGRQSAPVNQNFNLNPPPVNQNRAGQSGFQNSGGGFDRPGGTFNRGQDAENLQNLDRPNTGGFQTQLPPSQPNRGGLSPNFNGLPNGPARSPQGVDRGFQNN